ncbi:hypothetical protein [Muricoccus radiodurans]|uniref:hypothetical protein n=1 Tax=Muricoccus radiodurans TaxID=2231721 RepID=UPI003CF6D77E
MRFQIHFLLAAVLDLALPISERKEQVMSESQPPHSLLEAARAIARLSGLPWPNVQRVYVEMQSEKMLPVSRGRAVWQAIPSLVAELLIGIACAAEGKVLKQRVTAYSQAVREADGEPPTRFLDEMKLVLTDAAAASRLDRIVFAHDTNRVTIFDTTGEGAVFVANSQSASKPVLAIGSRGVILGTLIQALATEMRWGSPVGQRVNDGGEPDAE